jgi:hypothetical protein
VFGLEWWTVLVERNYDISDKNGKGVAGKMCSLEKHLPSMHNPSPHICIWKPLHKFSNYSTIQQCTTTDRKEATVITAPGECIWRTFEQRKDFFLWNWGLNSGLHACKTGALLLEVHLQSILLWLFWRWGLTNYLAWASLESWASQSQSPKLLGQQVWATSTQLDIFKAMIQKALRAAM